MSEHPIKVWIDTYGSVVEELSDAMQQQALESGWTGDLHAGVEQVDDTTDEVDLGALREAGRRLLAATLDAREIPPPPDPDAAEHWVAAISRLETAANAVSSDAFGSRLDATNAMAEDYLAGVDDMQVVADAVLRATGQPLRDWSSDISN